MVPEQVGYEVAITKYGLEMKRFSLQISIMTIWNSHSDFAPPSTITN